MAKIPNKVKARLIKETTQFKKVLESAKSRDVNESDTVTIITDMLERVFGFDKYSEVTSELCIKGQFCDLAVKLDGNFEYLIEVKAIGMDLKDSHLRQATNYGANHGIPWIVLTNGMEWQLYKVRFERPVDVDHLCTFDFSQINPRNEEDLAQLFLLCRSGVKKHAIEEYHDRVQSVNRFIIGAILESESVANTVRRELKKLSPGLKITADEITKLITSEVLKRDVTEGEAAEKAQAKLKRSLAKVKRAKAVQTKQMETSVESTGI